MHVLVLDDNALVAMDTSDTLTEAGHEAMFFTSLPDFQEHILNHGMPDAVICDGDLVTHTVMDVRPWLESLDGGSQVLFVLHTGSHATALIRTGYTEAYPGEPVWLKANGVDMVHELQALLTRGNAL